MPKGIYKRSQYSRPENNQGDPDTVFLSRIDKNGPTYKDLGNCWIWLGAKIAQGYGQFRGNRVHRYAYNLLVGAIPDGMFVCHRCDNPPCVNPDHLFLGTAQDNMDDKVAKGRQGDCGPKVLLPKGERNVKAKLTNEEVLLIRRIYRQGSKEYGSVALGKLFGVTHGQILNIVKRKTWTHL